MSTRKPSGMALGELVTLPSLANVADWERFEQARIALAQNLSLDRAADRYKQTEPA